MVETPLLTRRRFFQAGMASIAIAGVPLSAGMPVAAETSATKLFAIQAAGKVHQYELLIPWDWTTAVYCGKQSEIPYPHDCFDGYSTVAFKPDGTEMYVTDA